ncbi:hypothetical protein GCM10022380_70150 [Amycolatopsis tucumanensis]|uniref:Uncharacterized protein n=1 Tax=Amycolatopsis tucumanensis TaxID=401106 RepID=A0ABP7JD62_9PSEU
MEAVALSEDEVAALMAKLPERLADRIPPDRLRTVRQDRDAGEWLETAQVLIGTLARTDRPVSTRERAQLRELLRTFAKPGQPEWLATTLDGLRRALTGLPEVTSLSEPQIAEKAKTLRATFGERIPETDRWELEDAEDEQDWEDLTQATVRLLSRHRIPVTAAERRTLWLLLDAMDLSREGLLAIPER